VTIDGGGERGGHVGQRIDGIEFAGSMSDAMVAQFSPASCPAKKAFFRFNAIG
jgi:hypothetical protein